MHYSRRLVEKVVRHCVNGNSFGKSFNAEVAEGFGLHIQVSLDLLGNDYVAAIFRRDRFHPRRKINRGTDGGETQLVGSTDIPVVDLTEIQRQTERKRRGTRRMSLFV